MRHLDQALLREGLLDAAALEEAHAAQRVFGGSLGHALVRLGAVAEDDLLAVLARHYGLPVIGPEELPAAEAVRAAVEAVGAPLDWLLARDAAIWFDGAGRLVLAAPGAAEPDLAEAAERWSAAEPPVLCFASRRTLDPLLGELTIGAARALAQPGDLARLRELAEEAPVIDFVNAIFTEAISRRASDVHLEPFEDHFVVRLRIDGALTLWRSAPRALFDAVASRVKLLSGMDIAERRLPQDGRQSIRVSGREVDLRVSSLPTTWGESLVLRLLGKSGALPDFDALGVAGDHLKLLLGAIEMHNGILLVTGPTGSGKTTTIYRLIGELKDTGRKIVTVEDPVEFDLPGVAQMHVRADIGLTFAAGLRSILRQDPDVIMVGEIRDAETAKIAVQAALTGHLVISTLHTNSALAAALRLMDLGVEPFLLADVLRALVGQRLLRRLCEHCAALDDDPSLEAFARERLPAALIAAPARWRRAVGCSRCGGLGFQGRLGAYEVAAVDPRLREAIRARGGEPALEAEARAGGFRTMGEDGLMKARAGATTLREVLRVLSL